MQRFEQNADAITAENCRANAERFATVLFQRRYIQTITEAWRDHGGAVEGMASPKVA